MKIIPENFKKTLTETLYMLLTCKHVKIVKYVKIDENNYIFSLRAHVSDEALIPYPVLHTPSHFPAPLTAHPLVLRQFG